MKNLTSEEIEAYKVMNWYDLQSVAITLVDEFKKSELMELILIIWPVPEGNEYIGSMANHFRGRLKHEGAHSLVNQMDSVSMRLLIIGLRENQSTKPITINK